MAKAALAWLVRRWNLVMPPAMPKHRKVLEASWSFLVCPLVTYIDTKPKEHLPQYDELWMKSRPDIIWYHPISNTCANGSGKPGPCWEENASSHTLQFCNTAKELHDCNKSLYHFQCTGGAGPLVEPSSHVRGCGCLEVQGACFGEQPLLTRIFYVLGIL